MTAGQEGLGQQHPLQGWAGSSGGCLPRGAACHWADGAKEHPRSSSWIGQSTSSCAPLLPGTCPQFLGVRCLLPQSTWLLGGALHRARSRSCLLPEVLPALLRAAEPHAMPLGMHPEGLSCLQSSAGCWRRTWDTRTCGSDFQHPFAGARLRKGGVLAREALCQHLSRVLLWHKADSLSSGSQESL